MDATGLTVGIVGLIIATLDLMAKCRVDKPDRDSEYLSIRLDLQKLLYNQWAYQVGVHQPGKHDRRLDNRETSEAVHRTLVAIQNLLKDAGVVVDYYQATSLSPSPSPALDATPDTVALTGGAGKRRMERLLSRMKSLKLSTSFTPHEKQPEKPGVFTNLFRKGKWIYGDKRMLEEFINTLEILVSNLRELLGPMDIETKNAMAMMSDEDLEFVADEKALRLYLLEAIRLGNDEMANSARRGLILSKLFLKGMDRRLGSIKEAHKDTLKWALGPEDFKSKDPKSNDPKTKDPQGNPKWDHLPTWLGDSSSSTYWVSGKAGSGKSTLMKYLLKNFETDDKEARFLPFRDWAGDSKVTVCNFFFKRHGSVDQTSLRGLSQSLVYQVLRKHRLLIEDAVPDMWKSLLDHPTSDLKMPTTKQMCKAAQIVARSSKAVNNHFLFLIDGLDEFVNGNKWKDINEKDSKKSAQSVAGQEEDDEETAHLLALIDSLAALPHVKMLISSRPTSVYYKKYNHGKKLKMERLNRGCIDSYIEGKLETNEHFIKLKQEHPKEISDLFKDIAEKSSGIFLWVNLACKSLLNGALGNDNIVELRKRVDKLPDGLEKMFKHMLDDGAIDVMHRQQGARVLDFCRDFHQTKAFNGEALGFPEDIREHYEGDDGPGREITEPEIRALSLARIDERMFCSFDPKVLEESKINTLVDDLEDRLRMRCGGLIEVHREALDNPESRRKVVFIHRSVQEFLTGDNGRKYLSDHVGKNWDLQWTRTLYWLQRVADVYSWDRPMDKEFSRSGATVWLPIFNSRIWTMQNDKRFPKILARLKDLLNKPPNMSSRPSTHAYEVSIQWLKTTTCRDAGPELGQSCLRTALAFLAPYYPNPEGIFEDDKHLNALIAHSQKSGCLNCMPPLLFAIDQFAMALFTENSESLTFEAEIMRDLITYLVQRGADFNQRATLLKADGRALTTTPWQHFVTLFACQVNPYGPEYWDEVPFAAQTLYAVEEFLNAGAHVTLQDLDSLFPLGFNMDGLEGDLILDGEGDDDHEHAVTPVAGAGMPSNCYGLPAEGHGKGLAASPNGFHEFEPMDVDAMEVDQQPDTQMDCDKAVGVATMDDESEPADVTTLRGQFEYVRARIWEKQKAKQAHLLPSAVLGNVPGSFQPERISKRPAEDAGMNDEERPSQLRKLEE